MKNTKLYPVIVVLAGILLSACSGPRISLAPVNTNQSLAASLTHSGASLAGTSSASVQQVSAPLSSAPAAIKPQASADLAGLQSEYEAIYEKVNPSVVTIEISSKVSSFHRSTQPGSQSDQVVPVSEGSGFIWDTSGHIVTNNHVVEGAEQINVTFSDGTSYAASVVGTDPNTDLAVIQVSGAPAALLKPVSVGDSTQVKVGELVVAIGNPYGLGNTMTTGIVSAIARSIQSGTGHSQNGSASGPSFSIPDVIQTDAAINPGNSGGVLVDLNGDLIGVPAQIESASGSNSGIGFAIPAAIVKRVAPELITKGAVSHSYLGISGTTLSASLASTLKLPRGQQGVLIAEVIAGGPSEKAGLKGATMDANGNPSAAGDIITAIDGKTVTRFEDMVSYLSASTHPGQAVTLDILRDGKTIQVTLTLGTQPTH